MGKTWVLDTETKGTGANVVPLEKAQQRSEEGPKRHPRKSARPKHERPRRPTATSEVERTATALPPGHVRKRATGEIGKVQAVDSKAGTATVRWLKHGGISTVPLSAVSRR